MSGRDDEDRQPLPGRKIACIVVAAVALMLFVAELGADPEPPTSSSADSTITDSFSEGIEALQNDTSGELASTDTPMSFDACISTIQHTAAEVGEAPINIVETGSMRVVRFRTEGGSVLMSCGYGKLVVTRSPHSG